MKRLLALTCLLATMACTDVRQESSEILTEPAKVVSIVFTPGFHRSDVDVGIGFDGNISIVPTSITVPDKHGVVFECQHGKFFIQRKSLFDRLTLGQEVIIHYKELYRATYEDDVCIERVLYDYDFLDAK